MDQEKEHCQIRSPQETPNSQYMHKTLSNLKKSFEQDAIELFSKTAKGGIVSVYLEKGLPICFINDPLLRQLGYTYQEFMDHTKGKFINTIIPADQDDYLLAIHTAFEQKITLEHLCRVHQKNGTFCWMQDIGKRISLESGKDAFMLLRTDATEIMKHFHDLENKVRKFDEKSRQLAALTANIPGGVCEISIDKDFTLIYGNDGFYTLCGYTAEQLKLEHNNQLLSLIYAPDRRLAHQAINKAYRARKKGVEFEHRIITRDLATIWVLVRGNFSHDNVTPSLNCVVVDINNHKKIEEELKINEKRFRIALSQTDNTIFDYDIRSSVMIHGDKSAKVYGLEKITENVPYSLVENHVIHPDSTKAFLEMYQHIRNGKRTASCIIKTRLKQGSYVWRKISMTTIFDENGRPARAVGILVDIDAQIRREEELRYRSERDPLTNLYNRGATVLRSKNYLETPRKDTICALLIIDIDKFKNVNDQFGHIFGDYILSEASRRLTGLFHAEDVIGRIGGDEFIVFMCYLPNSMPVQRRAQKVCYAFLEPFVCNGVQTTISCSIGIALYPHNGQTYEELYQNADIALYKAKKSGRNKFVLYNDDLNNSQNSIPYSSTKLNMDCNTSFPISKATPKPLL